MGVEGEGWSKEPKGSTKTKRSQKEAQIERENRQGTRIGIYSEKRHLRPFLKDSISSFEIVSAL